MKKTHIVLGNMRGGTSMVAGVLRILGINMGDNIDPNNHEDLDLQHRHPLHLRQLIADKNERYNEWGWKDPLLVDHIAEVFRLCAVKNAHLYFVFRDIYATASGISREEGWPLDYCLGYVQKQNEKLVEAYQRYHGRLPTFATSYEKSIVSPVSFVTAIAKFAEVEWDNGMMDQAVRFITPGYKSI